jgi:hypothetical protein
MLCSCSVREVVCCTLVLYSPLYLHSFLAETIYVRLFGFPQALYKLRWGCSPPVTVKKIFNL